jgi:ribosomal protein L37E
MRRPVNPPGGEPPTGEPCAGNPPARFGGRGSRDNRLSLPLCARVNTHSQRGESPLKVVALRPEADCNCVAERQGGEQQEANDQSAGIRTRFGLMISASLRRKGEATYPQERVICRACGVAKKRRQRDMGCLGAEWTEGYARKHGDPVRGGDRAGSQSVHSSVEVG